MKHSLAVRNNFKKQDDKSDKVWFQITAILIACLSSITLGLQFAWSSPSIPKIVNDKINYDITLDEASYFTVLPPIGAIISSIFFSKIVDVVGRKYTVWFMAIPHIIAWTLIATAKSVYVFYAARFINGIGDGCHFAALPMYIGEITSPKIRGTWGNAMTLFIYFGQLMINVIGSYTTIRQTAYICVGLPIIFAIAFAFMPETPYFYLMKNRDEDARRSLQKFRDKEDVEEELKALKADVERQMSESGTWMELLTIESNRKALYAGIFLRVSQQLGGIACFAVYTQYIFAKAGGSLSASTSAIIFSGLCTVLNFVASLTLDKLGRQKSYLYSCILCGIVLLLESAYFFIEQFHPELNLNPVNWMPIAGMILFVLFYSFGLGIVPTLMLGELFSASIKAKGLCVLGILFGVLVSSITKIFHVLDTSVGLYAPFLLFSLSCFAGGVLSLYFVPETKGKTLEEIQQSLKSSKTRK